MFSARGALPLSVVVRVCDGTAIDGKRGEPDKSACRHVKNVLRLLTSHIMGSKDKLQYYIISQSDSHEEMAAAPTSIQEEIVELAGKISELEKNISAVQAIKKRSKGQQSKLEVWRKELEWYEEKLQVKRGQGDFPLSC